MQLRWLVFALVLVACRGGGEALGPLESYQLLAPAGPGAPPLVHALPVGDEPALTLGRVLNDGFGGEMVRTVHLAKQLVRHLGGAAYPESVRTAAGQPLLLVVGAGAEPPISEGLAFDSWLGGPKVRGGLRWLGLSGNVEGDKALVQTLSGRLGAHAAAWVAGGNTPLVDSYRMAMEVIAREWRPSNGAAGSLKANAGTSEQRHLFATVRENHAVMTEDGGLRPAADMLGDPRVGATVLHRLAQTRRIAHTAAADALYAPFVPGGLPAGISPAAVLGPVRNFQAKLLTAWGNAVAAGKPPANIVDLVEAYARLFPDERPELLRIFLVTTFGATVLAGGVSPKPEDATATLARLTTLTDEVVGGKRGLRDALAAKAP
jgi:hypothetical protein